MSIKKPDRVQPVIEAVAPAGPRVIASGQQRMRRARWRQTGIAYLFLAPNIIGFLFFTLFSLIAALGLSFFRWSLLSAPQFTGLNNYVQLFTTDPVFHQVLVNTLYFVFIYVPLNIVVSLGMAVWLSGPIRFKNLFRIIMFLPVLTPAVGVALVWLLMYDQNGINYKEDAKDFGLTRGYYLFRVC